MVHIVGPKIQSNPRCWGGKKGEKDMGNRASKQGRNKLEAGQPNWYSHLLTREGARADGYSRNTTPSS